VPKHTEKVSLHSLPEIYRKRAPLELQKSATTPIITEPTQEVVGPSTLENNQIIEQLPVLSTPEVDEQPNALTMAEYSEDLDLPSYEALPVTYFHESTPSVDTADTQETLETQELFQNILFGSEALPEEVSSKEIAFHIDESEPMEQFVQLFTGLAPEQIEAAETTLSEIAIKVHEMMVIINPECSISELAVSEQLQVINEQLNQLCTELFEGLGVEYTPESIDKLVSLMMKYAVEARLPQEQQDNLMDDRNERGTHEHKFAVLGLAGTFLNIIHTGQSTSWAKLLGRVTLLQSHV
jgi:hypothetical protein